MKKIGLFVRKICTKGMSLGVLNAIAFVAALSTIDAACAIIHHQPELPAALEEYRKY